MMTAKDFSRKYARLYGVDYEYASTICKTVFKTLKEVLCDEKEDVNFYGFGSFKHKTMAEKAVRHPVTGEMTKIPERDVIKFQLSETIE